MSAVVVGSGRMDLPSKLRLWIADTRRSISGLARELDVAYSTCRSWVAGETQMSVSALKRVAELSHLPMDYWVDEQQPFPAPIDYVGLRDEMWARLRAMSSDELRDFAALLREPGGLERATQIARLVRGGG